MATMDKARHELRVSVYGWLLNVIRFFFSHESLPFSEPRLNPLSSAWDWLCDFKVGGLEPNLRSSSNFEWVLAAASVEEDSRIFLERRGRRRPVVLFC